MKAVRIGGLMALAVTTAVAAWTAGTAWAAHCGTGTTASCTENVRETKHNLAINDDVLANGTSEVCVFCHTPHGGRTDVAGGGAPLWNRALPPSVTTGAGAFTVYTSPNFDNSLDGEAAGPKGVSLACLSCHDGTIALDAVINAPGSGGFTPANRNALTGIEPGTGLPSITFSGPGVESNGSMGEGDRPESPSGGGYTGGDADYVGGAAMEPFPNLGRNLTDDHPISIRMPADDPQFADARANLRTVGTNTRVQYVARLNAQTPTDLRDTIRLYNSTVSGTTADWVECASCHNPHTPRTTFLRLPSTPAGVTPPADGNVTVATNATRNLNHEPNQGSLICLTCHQK